MSQPNVFIEAFCEVIPPYSVPLADAGHLAEALSRADAVFDSYHDLGSGQPKVDEGWLQDTVYDFGEWLAGRTPYGDSQSLWRTFRHSRLVALYAALDLNVFTTEAGEMLSEEGFPIGAYEIANHLTRQALVIDGNLTVAFTCDFVEETRVFEIPGGTSNPDTNYGTPPDGDDSPWPPGVYNALLIAFLMCMASSYGALCITSRIPDKKMGAFAAGFAFAHGRFWPVSPSTMTNMVGDLGRFITGPETPYAASSYEMAAVEMANAIMDVTGSAFEVIFPGTAEGSLSLSVAGFPGIGYIGGGHASVLYEEGAGGDTIVTPDGMVLIPGVHVERAPLSKIFEDVHGSVIEGDSDEASRIVAVAAIARSASHYLTMPPDEARAATESMLIDFGMFYELSEEAYDFNEDELTPVLSSAAAINRERDDAIYLNLYNEMEDDSVRKGDIDAIVDGLSHQSKYVKKVGIFEPVEKLPSGPEMDVFSEQTSVVAFLMTAPARDENLEEHLRTMCTRCSYSDKGATMFFALEDEQGHLTKLAAVQWTGGRWRNLGEERIHEIVQGTNIGQILNIQPDGNEDIIRFERGNKDG